MTKKAYLWLICLLTLFSRPVLAQTLQSHADVQVTGSNFAYTIYNDEVTGTDQFLYGFTLITHAPFNVVQTPVGWGYDTDNLTYIDWINDDPNFPSSYDVAPSKSLSGFVLSATGPVESTLQAYTIQASDHTTGNNGSVTAPSVQVLSPSILNASVPETSSKGLLVAMTFSSSVLLFGVWRRAQCSKA